MKKFSLISALILALVLLASPAMAQEGGGRVPGKFGIGIGDGSVASGISLKAFTGATAVQGVIGCWGYNCDGLGVSVDLLFNQAPLVQAGPLVLAWNVGFGGSAAAWRNRHTYVAAQGVLGLEFIFPDVPLDLVLELRPEISIVPGVDFDLDGGAHVRFYF
ncbi:hypothetical protein DL240_10640 [Lujinxingia litoralis]|uniref:DUF3996 domain-containing protein n=1 Tax=Lujinxingia litoralis TaxID=2211119 RepID=A0A328C4Q4_9DELT|nr:hypothetical protein [Lujinxingia litoralis]RAL22301.1 hypothetical protein DL240_10640 [Lujinxingia litoralis]